MSRPNCLGLTPLSLDLGAGVARKKGSEDPYGNIDRSLTGGVTIALGSDPADGVLAGTLTVQPTNGVARFDDLTLSKAGSGYTLRATGPGSLTGVSTPFDLTDKLVVTTQPPSAVKVGTPFGLTVSIENARDDVDTSFSGYVTVADVEGDVLGGR
jgi:hypothetical protein